MASPFESSVVTINPAAATAAVAVTDESALSKASVRAADGTAAADALGLTFGSAEHRGDTFVARVRPDEWFIFGSDTAEASTVVDGLDLSGYASTVDITYSRMMLRVTGVDAAKVMEKVCSLDFADHMTPNGACAGASVAKVGCDVIRDDVDDVRSYRILCDRSFGQYFYDALIDAAAEFNG